MFIHSQNVLEQTPQGQTKGPGVDLAKVRKNIQETVSPKDATVGLLVNQQDVDASVDENLDKIFEGSCYKVSEQ